MSYKEEIKEAKEYSSSYKEYVGTNAQHGIYDNTSLHQFHAKVKHTRPAPGLGETMSREHRENPKKFKQEAKEAYMAAPRTAPRKHPHNKHTTVHTYKLSTPLPNEKPQRRRRTVVTNVAYSKRTLVSRIK